MKSFKKTVYTAPKKHGTLVLGGLLGFLLFTLTSHPKSKVHQKWPNLKVKNFQLQPHIKYYSKEKTYHVHHWMHMAAIYLPILIMRKGILRSKFLHGFFIGSIIQGLIYKDRFKIIKKLEELANNESPKLASR